MIDRSQTIVHIDMKRRIEYAKSDIVSGKIRFFNPPEKWGENELHITAINIVMRSIQDKARWN